MSSAICFSFDQSKLLSSGNGLIEMSVIAVMYFFAMQSLIASIVNMSPERA